MSKDSTLVVPGGESADTFVGKLIDSLDTGGDTKAAAEWREVLANIVKDRDAQWRRLTRSGLTRERLDNWSEAIEKARRTGGSVVDVADALLSYAFRVSGFRHEAPADPADFADLERPRGC